MHADLTIKKNKTCTVPVVNVSDQKTFINANEVIARGANCEE